MLPGDDHESIAESLTQKVGRTVRTAHEVGFTRDFLTARWAGLPSILSVAVREGIQVGSIHQVMADLHPDRKAVVDSDREWTFDRANDEINRLANAMRQRFGVDKGTPVVISMKNRAEYLTIWMALSRIGASTVHASWRQTAEELAYQVEDSGARLMFADANVAEAVDELRESVDVDRLQIVGVDEGVGEFSYQAVVEASVSDYPFGTNQESSSENVVYTSGTTGRPKGAVRDLGGYGIVELFQILERLPMRTADRHLIVCPMYHSGGQVFSVMNAALGSSLYILSEFDPEETLKTLHEEAINTVFLVPTMLRRILDLPEEVLEEYSTPALRGIFCGAAPFPQALRERAIEQFGASVIHDFYGATEIGWITLIDGEEMLERPGSVGRPIAGQEVRILDEDGNEVGPGEPGRIYVRNDHIMAGYLNREEATEEIVEDGWMTVEDLGYLDEDGYLYISGRERDMIISGGVNIYPPEIEEVLQRHDQVREVAVVGVEDDEWGERVVAVIAADGEPDIEELEKFTREHLAGYKVPRSWHFVDELPRNPTGKVLKRQLEERFG